MRNLPRGSIVTLAAALALGACARTGPPAPVTQGQATRPAAAQAGARVTVLPGDTLYAIARREKVPLRALIDANRLQPPYTLLPGQTLALPHVSAPAVAAAPPPREAPKPAATNATVPPPSVGPGAPSVPPPAQATEATPAPAPAAAAEAVAPPAPPAPEDPLPPPRGGRAFVWPVRGNVISTFGAKPGGTQNDGINIAAPRGAPVRAADAGVVVYAGNELKGFGNLLLLRHADGWMTAYAHLDEIAVERGQIIQRGQVVAKVGQSGGVTSPQLHFEVRRGTRPVDPKDHLQPLVAAALR